jgi:hypothetical protein
MTQGRRNEIEDADRREDRERLERYIAQEDEQTERIARERAFIETPHCELACYESPDFTHADACLAFSAYADARMALMSPVQVALSGWKIAVTSIARERRAA